MCSSQFRRRDFHPSSASVCEKPHLVIPPASRTCFLPPLKVPGSLSCGRTWRWGLRSWGTPLRDTPPQGCTPQEAYWGCSHDECGESSWVPPHTKQVRRGGRRGELLGGRGKPLCRIKGQEVKISRESLQSTCGPTLKRTEVGEARTRGASDCGVFLTEFWPDPSVGSFRTKGVS